MSAPPGRRATLVLAAVVLALLFVAIASAVHEGLAAIDTLPVTIVVDGQDVSPSFDFAGLPAPERFGIASGIAAAAVALLIVVPVVLFAVLFGAIGAPLLIVTLILALLLSPLIALGALLVWALRRPRPPSATIGR